MGGIGIVIVTHNSGREIGRCLDAALCAGAEVVVVDNASADDTIAEVKRRPAARLIANSANRGFAAATNQGFIVLNQPYILLLNPDAVVKTDLEPLRLACELPAAAGAGGELLGSEGRAPIRFMSRRPPQ